MADRAKGKRCQLGMHPTQIKNRSDLADGPDLTTMVLDIVTAQLNDGGSGDSPCFRAAGAVVTEGSIL